MRKTRQFGQFGRKQEDLLEREGKQDKETAPLVASWVSPNIRPVSAIYLPRRSVAFFVSLS